MLFLIGVWRLVCVQKIYISLLDILPGSVRLFFLLFLFVGLVVASIFMYGEIQEIPPLPERLVMEKAYLYRDVSQSRTTSSLYLRVGLGEDAYNYIIEASASDIQHLNLRKGKKLWVAVDSDRTKRFVWWIYDVDTNLLISRKDILLWIRSNNIECYFVLIGWSIILSYLLLIIVRNGIWNRVVAKGRAYEN
ncbi:hypothetical protein SAMN04490195_0266 [Pseudomonas moorei]|uniref:Uncharacterized protein n=1 Tax=Pseudomonas moorei TaxID=395599 RepID=A0A1H0XXY7_9PSED|nr:hypothetical protein SAMN04490195_0266 [Pseudomonas moorei]